MQHQQDVNTTIEKGFFMNKFEFKRVIKHSLFIVTIILTPLLSHASMIFINEIHYDNYGADQEEFVELAGSAGLSLTDWSILLYNGSNGLVYKTIDIGNYTLADTTNGFGFYSLNITGIQNGASNGIGDGIALVDNTNQLRQFISYEGAFEAQDGAAQGILSQDINIAQNSSPLGLSLQLTGSGNSYQDFTWGLANESSGGKNIEQSFVGGSKNPVVTVSEPNLVSLFLLSIVLMLFSTKLTKRHSRVTFKLS